MANMNMNGVEYCNPAETRGDGVISCSNNDHFDHYLNQCSSAKLIQFDDQENEFYMEVIYGYILPILSFIVLISNGVVIYVLNEQKNKRATVEPLLWMAVSALFMSISPLPFTIYYYNLNHLRDVNQNLFLCYLQKICMEILPFFFNTLITLFTLLLGTQRFIAVQFPLDSFRWCTRKMIRFYSKIVFLFSFVLTVIHSIFDIRVIYHFCIEQPGSSFWTARCFIGYSTLTSAMGAGTLASIFDTFRVGLVIIPSFLLCIITLLLIRTIKTSSNTDKLGVQRNKRNKASNNTTVMLTVIIILFLLARAPSAILILVVKISEFIPMEVHFARNIYLRAMTNIIAMSLHPISFAIYMFMSRRFRVSLRRLLGWRFLASDEEFNAFSSSVKYNSQHRKQDNGAQPLVHYKYNSSVSSVRTSRMSLREPRRGVAFAAEVQNLDDTVEETPPDTLQRRSTSYPLKEVCRTESADV